MSRIRILISNEPTFAALVENLKGQNVKLQVVNGKDVNSTSPTLPNMSMSDSDLDAKSDRIFGFLNSMIGLSEPPALPPPLDNTGL